MFPSRHKRDRRVCLEFVSLLWELSRICAHAYWRAIGRVRFLDPDLASHP